MLSHTTLPNLRITDVGVGGAVVARKQAETFLAGLSRQITFALSIFLPGKV